MRRGKGIKSRSEAVEEKREEMAANISESEKGEQRRGRMRGTGEGADRFREEIVSMTKSFRRRDKEVRRVAEP